MVGSMITIQSDLMERSYLIKLIRDSLEVFGVRAYNKMRLILFVPLTKKTINLCWVDIRQSLASLSRPSTLGLETGS